MFTTRSPSLERSVSDQDRESIRFGTPVKVEPQDEDLLLTSLPQEEEESRRGQSPSPPPALPLAQPEPRRSARIQARSNRQEAVPPKVKAPAKSTSRKRAVRKK